ncbi:MAG: hypothetical protein M0R70_12850 [Nitrospirae bacterium]|nr:hypothetical protein [Nitrospirota bacterium]
MTKSNKKTSPATNQLTIFDLLCQSAPHPSGCMDFQAELCSAMSADIRHAVDEQGRELSRYDIAARMSNSLNREITKSTLDNWTAASHDAHIPDAIEMAAFSRATIGRCAMEVISRHAGLFTLPGPEALRSEIQTWKETRNRAYKEIRKRELLLSEVERAR